jgi:ABC-type nitrate/sulfonate/bicarbonate transport system substrate-binding protein
VAIVPSTISESYLYEYLARAGQQQLLEKKQLNCLISKPADIPGHLKSGAARSAVIWEPFLSLSAQLPGMRVVTDGPAFEVNLYLLTRSRILETRADSIRDFLTGVRSACEYLKSNSDTARHEIEARYQFHSDFLAAPWSRVAYGLSYDRERMNAELLREARVSHALGRISQVPSFESLFRMPPPQPGQVAAKS